MKLLHEYEKRKDDGTVKDKYPVGSLITRSRSQSVSVFRVDRHTDEGMFCICVKAGALFREGEELLFTIESYWEFAEDPFLSWAKNVIKERKSHG